MTVADWIYKALQDCPAARSDDYDCMEYVLLHTARENNVPEQDVRHAMETLRRFPFRAKTITRERARLQKKLPELANPKTVEMRKALEQEYREHYRANSERTVNRAKVMSYDPEDLPEVEFDDPDQVTLF